MQAKIIRETVLNSAAAAHGVAASERDAMFAEAHRLRAPDPAGHGITQLRQAGDILREQGVHAAEAGERFEWGETALQVAIVLLSIAMVARSTRMVFGAVALAGGGVLIAVAAALGVG